MEFERIGRNTVQCHMTVEEMNEYGLRIEDFFTNQEKSRDFLEKLVERAEEEIGYEVETGMISMQLMRMPDDSLVITFSDRGEESLQNMLNQLQNLAGLIDEKTAGTIVDAMSKEVGATSEEELYEEEEMPEMENGISEHYQGGKEETEWKRQKRLQLAARVYCFDRLDTLEHFANTIRLQKNIPSRLYRDAASGRWYLLVKKGKLKLEEYQSLCRQLSEYGTLCMKHPYMEHYCREHYENVIGKQALRAIMEYAG